MHRVTGFSCVRTEGDRVESFGLPESVEDLEVAPDEVQLPPVSGIGVLAPMKGAFMTACGLSVQPMSLLLLNRL